MNFEGVRARLAAAPAVRLEGRVVAVRGVALRLRLPGARLGDAVTIHRRGGPLSAEIVGFEEDQALAVGLGDLVGTGPDDVVEGQGEPLSIDFSEQLCGRVLDGLGRPLDGAPLPGDCRRLAVHRPPPPALERLPVVEALPTGVRVLDGLMTLGRGQRVALFSTAGVGKSQLLSSVARGADADVLVVALVGERGREVADWLDAKSGAERVARTVTVVATSDASALERVRAAQTATTIAEGFRDAGNNVLLLVDSLTRLARAQREIGLATGEPPGRRGYPPSVFALLPRLVERAGRTHTGSITAVYSVLTEGDAVSDPVADEVRGLVDGHWVLSGRLAEQGHYPAVDVEASLSRLMSALTKPEHQRSAQVVRRWWSAYEEKRDLIALGAYQRGSDAAVDQALARWDAVRGFLCQELGEGTPLSDTIARLERLTA